MSAIDFVRSLYTVSDGNTLNGWSSSPSNGDTATANSQTYTYSSSRNLWVLATGVTNTITDGATYSWDGEKWIAQSHIPFRYFGPQASDPTGMSSDDAGDLYFNTTTDKLKVYTGSAWEDYSVPDDGSITPAKLSTGGPYWNTSGDVGVGATSPVFGAGSGLEVLRSGVATVRVSSNTQAVELRSDAGTGTLETRGSFPLKLGTAGTERMRIDSSGRVGIGTTPSGADGIFNLDINGTALHLGHGSNYDNYITCGSSGNQIFRAGGNERFRITSSGNVGIGTASPTEKLTISKSGAANIFPLHIENTVNYGWGVGLKLRQKLVSGGSVVDSAAILSDWQSNNNSTLEFSTNTNGSLTEKVRIDSSGRVGIGTTSPSDKLSVAGSSSGDFRALTLRNSSGATNSTASLTFEASSGTEGNAASIAAQIKGARLGGGTTGGLQFWTANSGTPAERMRIDNSGRMLVGLTSARTDFWGSLAANVQVEGSSFAAYSCYATNGNGAFIFGRDNGSNGSTIGNLSWQADDGTDEVESARISAQIDGVPGSDDMPGRLTFHTTADGADSVTERMRIDSAGRVGIGTTSPSVNLDISPSSGAAEVRIAGAEGEEASIRLYADQGDDAADIKKLLTDTSGNFKIQHYAGSSFVDSMVINSSGNVGIGTSSPGSFYANSDDLVVGTGSGHNGITIFAGTTSDSSLCFADGTASSAPFIGRILYEHNTDSLSFDTNASQRMKIDSSGKVGIGTSSPSSGRLHVYTTSPNTVSAPTMCLEGGTNAYGAGIDFAARTSSGGTLVSMAKITADGEAPWNTTASTQDAGLRFFTALNGSLSERMRLDRNGNIGIGTTAPNNYTNYTTLTVNGTTGGEVDFESNGTLKGQIYATSSSGFYVDSRGSTTPLVFKTNTTERMRIDSSGRVIIGQTSSQGSDSTLQIRQDGFGANVELFRSYDSISTPPRIRFSCSKGTNASPAVVTSGTNLGEIRFNGYDGLDYLSQAAKLSCAVDGTASANDMPGRLEFYTTSDGSNTPTERMRINSSGLVGIGTTSPVHTLQIHATNPQIRLQETSASSKRLDLFVDPSTALGVMAANQSAQGLAFQTTNSERMRIDSTGRVLIGGSDPGNSSADELTLISTGHTGMTIRSGTAHAGSLFFSDTTSGAYQYGGFIQYDHVADYLSFGANTNEAMRINSSGNLGIGRTNPQAKIDFQTNSDDDAMKLSGYNFLKWNNASQLHFGGYDASEWTKLSFHTSGTERLFINSDGETDLYTETAFRLRTARTSAVLGAFTVSNGASSISTGTVVMGVYSDGDLVNDNNSYGALSDSKLKENIVDATSQWDDLKALQVRKYNFKAETGRSTHTQIGVIAQEVETVSPGLVENIPDTDDDGNDLGTVTKSVNYSVLYLKAVKALQEAMTRIETLEAKVAALESN